MVLQVDGKILIGGAFTAVNGEADNLLARLSVPEAALQSLMVGHYDRVVTWNRSGAGPLALPSVLQSSTPGVAYTTLGTVVCLDDGSGWECNGLQAPTDQVYYLKAQAQVANAGIGESLIESVQQVYINSDRLFGDDFDR